MRGDISTAMCAELYDDDKKSLREIAAILDCSVELARRRLHQAGVTLRPAYKNRNHPGPIPEWVTLPFVGRWPDVLYKQGTCRRCRAPIFGIEHLERPTCGMLDCEARRRQAIEAGVLDGIT